MTTRARWIIGLLLALVIGLAVGLAIVAGDDEDLAPATVPETVEEPPTETTVPPTEPTEPSPDSGGIATPGATTSEGDRTAPDGSGGLGVSPP